MQSLTVKYCSNHLCLLLGVSLGAITPFGERLLHVGIQALGAREQCLAALTSKLETLQPIGEMRGALALFSPLLPPERCDLRVCPVKPQEQPESFQSE